MTTKRNGASIRRRILARRLRVLRNQLAHLSKAIDFPTVSLQVLPAGWVRTRRSHPGSSCLASAI